MVDRLSGCKKLNEFQEFVKTLRCDNTKDGRKFVAVDNSGVEHTYTMNQIIKQFALCIKNSMDNRNMRNEILNDIKNLNQSADRDTGCRRTLGNIWYKCMHRGFDKKEVLKNIEDGHINGTNELTADTINTHDGDGELPIIKLLSSNQPPEVLSLKLKEMLDNGADPLLLNDSGLVKRNALDVAIIIAKNEKNTVPLVTILSSMTKNNLVNMMSMFQSTWPIPVKTPIFNAVHKKNCIDVLYNKYGNDTNLQSFFSDYKFFLDNLSSYSMMSNEEIEWLNKIENMQ